MTLVRQTQVRFPETVTVKHGPIPLLSRFFLTADQYLRDRGIRLMARYDMEGLAELNRRETEKGTWYTLPRGFDPERNDLSPENCYWLCGVDESGETVLAHSARLYDWPDSSVADHAAELIYGDHVDPATPSIVDCPAAREVTGRVYVGGALWIHPDYRRFGLGSVAGHITPAFGLASWGADWSICLISRKHFELGMHHGYGYPDASLGLSYPGSPWGDPLELALCRQRRSDVLTKLERFLARPAAAKAA